MKIKKILKSQSFIKEIERNEGFRQYIHKDSLGFETIGYEFKVDCLSKDELLLNENLIEPMSKIVAEKILDMKLCKLETEVLKELPWLSHKENSVQEVVVEMAYWLGIDGMLKFKNTLKFIKQGELIKACENIKNSLWYKQAPNRVEKLIKNLKGDA